MTSPLFPVDSAHRAALVVGRAACCTVHRRFVVADDELGLARASARRGRQITGERRLRRLEVPASRERKA